MVGRRPFADNGEALIPRGGPRRSLQISATSLSDAARVGDSAGLLSTLVCMLSLLSSNRPSASTTLMRISNGGGRVRVSRPSRRVERVAWAREGVYHGSVTRERGLHGG
jgi:hypothetical protein